VIKKRREWQRGITCDSIAPATPSSYLLLLSLELSDTTIYEPEIRTLLGTSNSFYCRFMHHSTDSSSVLVVGAIGALMNRVHQPRTLLVLGHNAGMGTAAGADVRYSNMLASPLPAMMVIMNSAEYA
jgi:hypothetical protein